MYLLSLIFKSLDFDSVCSKSNFFVIASFTCIFDFERSSHREFLVLEKKVTKDFFYKKVLIFPEFDLKNFQVVYVDKESKVLGYKKSFDSTQKRLFLPFSENKKFLKSTIFGAIRFSNT